MTKSLNLISATLLSLGLCAGALAADEKADEKSDKPQSVWETLSDEQKDTANKYVEDYKDFIHIARTETSFVRDTKALAERHGFKPLTENSKLTAGAKYYSDNRGRALTLMVIGDKPMKEGFRVIGSHIDSPRIELKGRPVYEKQGFALFQTYVHGGIKTYHWVNIPLALTGHVDKKDGTRVHVSVGLEENDPIFIVPDLAPHVDKDYRNRTSREVIKKEELDVIIASRKGDSTVKKQVLAYLKDTYNIEERDLVSAELRLTPALKPKDVGFDRSLVAAYGHDDKVAAYASVRAILDMKGGEYTSMSFLVDNEEVGNVNNTGAESSYLTDLMSELIYQQDPKNYNDIIAKKAFAKTQFISTDVNPGVNPGWPGVWELGNAPKLGYGINIKLYGGGFNANSEMIATTRKYLDDAGIPWQTSTYKGKASGGTIGNDISARNMNVIDFGVPILSIHSPYAVASKGDIFALYLSMKAFFNH